MEDLHNRFIFSEWKHNNGFEQKWMRRITRQTKTQYIADCQHSLELSDKYTKLYNAGWDDMFSVFKKCAKRYRLVDNKLVGQNTHRSNPDGVRTITLIDDFNIMKCKYDYTELFDIDIRTVLPSDSKTLERANRTAKILNAKYKIQEDEMYTLRIRENNNSYTDCFVEVYNHLAQLFNKPVYMVDQMNLSINTTHDNSKYSNSAIHYHMNHFGGDKPMRTRKEDEHNMTISFWLFDDKVVFMKEDGIECW
jgi:hypothetical protein